MIRRGITRGRIKSNTPLRHTIPKDKPIELTRDQKVQKYRNGEYKVKPSPVCTVWWNEYDWIKFIDKHGVWIVKKSKR